MKKIVFGIILGILVGTITTVLASSLLASQISFKSKDSAWGVTNVQAAIDDLYDKSQPKAVKLLKEFTTNPSNATAYPWDSGTDITKYDYIYLELMTNQGQGDSIMIPVSIISDEYSTSKFPFYTVGPIWGTSYLLWSFSIGKNGIYSNATNYGGSWSLSYIRVYGIK